MHIGSPAVQILNLSVNQMEEQLWLCICKTSGELLVSTECRALLETHPPLQTATKTSPFSKLSCGSGKQDSFGAGGKRAGDKALLYKYGMWQWNEDLQGKQRRASLQRNGRLWGQWFHGSSVRLTLAELCPTDHTSSHSSKWALTNSHCSESAMSAKYWEDPTMRKKICLFLLNTPLFYKISPLLLERSTSLILPWMHKTNLKSSKDIQHFPQLQANTDKCQCTFLGNLSTPARFKAFHMIVEHKYSILNITTNLPDFFCNFLSIL